MKSAWARVVVLLSVLILSGGLPTCTSALPEEAVVRRVIDGDTVELVGGRLVRYLGIDTPEVRHYRDGEWVFDPEPFGEEAMGFNQQWVDQQRIRLEYDTQAYDRFGRMLAYVYVGDVMVNAELLKTGFAQPLILPPNLKHADEFRELAEQAKRQRRGIWAHHAPR